MNELTLAPGITHTTRDVIFPDGLDQNSWREYGRFLGRAKDGLSFWRARWIDFGRKQWGDDVVREAIQQLEFEFSEIRQAQLLNKIDVRDPELSAEHHFVLAKSKLDNTGRDMWVELSKKEALSPAELQESIKLGRVTKIAADAGKTWGAGFATVQGIERQWDLLLKQIANLWQEWGAEEIAEFRFHIADIVEFDRKLQNRAINLFQ